MYVYLICCSAGASVLGPGFIPLNYCFHYCINTLMSLGGTLLGSAMENYRLDQSRDPICYVGMYVYIHI